MFRSKKKGVTREKTKFNLWYWVKLRILLLSSRFLFRFSIWSSSPPFLFVFDSVRGGCDSVWGFLFMIFLNWRTKVMKPFVWIFVFWVCVDEDRWGWFDLCSSFLGFCFESETIYGFWVELGMRMKMNNGVFWFLEMIYDSGFVFLVWFWFDFVKNLGFMLLFLCGCPLLWDKMVLFYNPTSSRVWIIEEKGRDYSA
jgi:hypothetical protein